MSGAKVCMYWFLGQRLGSLVSVEQWISGIGMISCVVLSNFTTANNGLGNHRIEIGFL